MDIKNIELMNIKIEKALMLNYFDGGEKLKKIYAEAKEKFDESLKSFTSIEEKSKNKVFLPDEVVMLGENLERLKSYIESFDDEPKTLKPHNHALDRGKALSQSLSSDFREYQEGLQRTRDARYQSIIDEQEDELEGPMSRGGR